jgi:hypothetical protein
LAVHSIELTLLGGVRRRRRRLHGRMVLPRTGLAVVVGLENGGQRIRRFSSIFP